MVAGALANVLVAWSLAHWYFPLSRLAGAGAPPAVPLVTPHPWRVAVPSDWPAEPTSHSVTRRSWCGFYNQSATTQGDGKYGIDEFRFGLPMQALSGVRLWSTPLGAATTIDWASAFPPGGGGIPLPTRPLWGGFVVNTLFFAILIWLSFFTVAQLRRRLRLRSNKCPSCGYPLGQAPKCTECGAPLPRRLTTRCS